MPEHIIKKNMASIKAIGLGIAVALVVTMIAIMVFALVLKMADLPEGVIPTVNLIIKLLSVCLGVYMGLGKDCSMGWLKGLVIGSAYMLFGYVLFALVNGSGAPVTLWLNDLGMGGVAGAIAGIISVNIRKK